MTIYTRFVTLILFAVLSTSLMAQPPGPKLPKTGKNYEMYNTTAREYLISKDDKVSTSSSAGEEGKWQFISLGDKGYHIYNNKSKKYLTAPSSDAETSALVMVDKPTANSKWHITIGTGMNARYLFIRNAENNLYITGSGRNDITITHRKYNGGSGKMFNWKLLIK